MKPSHNDNFVASRKAIKALCYRRIHFKPRVRRPLRALLGRFAPMLDTGADQANRMKLRAFAFASRSLRLPVSFPLELHGTSPPNLQPGSPVLIDNGAKKKSLLRHTLRQLRPGSAPGLFLPLAIEQPQASATEIQVSKTREQTMPRWWI